MNHKIKRKWVNSLRHGNWEQITGMLHDEKNGRCALGVLTEIDTHWDSISGNVANVIMRMNDVERKSFNEIADWVEENL